MRTRRLGPTAASVAMLFLGAQGTVGCPGPSDGVDDPTPPGTPTWHQDIAPIVAGHCVHCHSDNNMAPFSFATYSEVKPMATWIGNVIRARTMPPWQPDPDSECDAAMPLSHDPSLTDAQIETWRAWARAEGPEGDPATAAPLPDPIDRALPNATRRLDRPAHPVPVDEDAYQCFLLDPEVDQTTWITAAQVVPDALDLLHHVWVWVVPPEQVAAVEQRVGADGSFDCPQTMGFESWPLVMGWLPDTLPMELPLDSGIRLDPGSRIVQQLHFHAWRDGGTDATSIDLRLTTDPPARTAEFRAFGNAEGAPILQSGPQDPTATPRFLIPAYADAHRETMRIVLEPTEGPFEVFGITGRMGWSGTKMSVKVERDGADPACLHRVRDWHPDWQRLYLYDLPLGELPVVQPGDAITVQCQYDNTIANPNVRDLVQDVGLDEPFDMELGSSRMDEMCFAIVGLLR